LIIDIYLYRKERFLPKAIWNDVVVADSDKTERVEGNVYFPPDSINKVFFRENPQTTVCPWKGVASYYDLVVDGQVNRAAAWYYPQPSAAAANIKNHVAFYGSVKIVRDSDEGDSRNGLVQRLRSMFG
jgi:uncharacterized protein (DUF427 family)